MRLDLQWTRSWILGSSTCPELKAGAKLLNPPGIPDVYILCPTIPFQGIHSKNSNKYVYKDIYTRKCTAALLLTMEIERTHLSKNEYLSKL